MDEREQSRRLRSVRALEPVDLPGPRHEETAATILPAVPRVGALDALLREVDDLRLTLETDLTLAAAAVEAGGTGTAVDIINKDIESVREFEDSALEHLTALADAEPTAAGARGRDWSRLVRLSAAPFVAAAAAVGLLLGVVPDQAGPAGVHPSSVSAQSSLQQLTTLAAQGRTSEVRVAALELHDRISALVETSPTNAVAAQQALLLLSYERTVIVQSGDGAALHDVLLLSAALAAKIRSALPSSLRTAVPAVPALRLPSAPAAPAPPRQQQTKSKPSASPSPSARATQSPKASASPSPSATTAPKPTATPTPSASSSPTPGTPFLSAADPQVSPGPLD